jgi:hypothetical protein
LLLLLWAGFLEGLLLSVCDQLLQLHLVGLQLCQTQQQQLLFICFKRQGLNGTAQVLQQKLLLLSLLQH